MGCRSGGLGLLRDLQDLYLIAAECDITWTLTRPPRRRPARRLALGVLEVANSDLGDDANRALLARSMADLLYAGTLAGWGLVAQVIGMSSFARREGSPVADDQTGAQEPVC